MGVEELKQALDDCIINFDAQVLVTNLLQDYQMPYADVNEILKQHIAEEEKKGIKFEKRFLVTGEEESTTNEIFKIVDSEKEMKEWLRKLKNAESALYSVEVAGGAKPAADIFVPMRWCPIQLDNMKTRAPLKTGASTSNETSSINAKIEIKAETKKPKGLNFPPANTKKPAISDPDNKSKIKEKNIKTSPTAIDQPKTPKKQNTPEDKKTTPTTKGNSKKSIANFFGPAKNEDNSKKPATGVVKPPTPKKMQDFFKKTEKTAPIPSKTKEQAKKVDRSMQLFDTEEDDNNADDNDVEQISLSDSPPNTADVDISDDEAQLESLRRKCSEDLDEGSNAAKKRRRIIDSDDDDDDAGAPQVKQEKKEAESVEDSTEVKETAQSETFLDDDGFVITIKAKNTAAAKKPAKAATPKKLSPKKEDVKKAAKTTPKGAAKTKQGNITSFFSKKGY